MNKLLYILLVLPFLSLSQNNKLYSVKLISYKAEDVEIKITDSDITTYEVNNIFQFILLENTKYFKKGDLINVILNCQKEKTREDKLDNLDFFISIGDNQENKLNNNQGWIVFYKNKKKDYVNLWCGYMKA
jgi:CRISPR/Cas system CMR-associated protein Cmr3 (group 5 of RAMP superfamily)